MANPRWRSLTMVRLEAWVPENGWAIVRRGQRYYIIRPPYDKSSLSAISAVDLQKAVSSHGFRHTGVEFSTWADLIRFVELEVEQARSTLSDSPKPGQAFIHNASEEDLQHFISETRNRLIPGQRWLHAENLLLALLEVESLRQSPRLLAEALEALKELFEAKQRAARLVHEVIGTNLAQNSPRAVKKFGTQEILDKARRVASRGSVLAHP